MSFRARIVITVISVIIVIIIYYILFIRTYLNKNVLRQSGNIIFTHKIECKLTTNANNLPKRRRSETLNKGVKPVHRVFTNITKSE